MARFKKYSYAQRIMLPVALDEQILPGTFEHAIHTLVESRIDISLFEHRFQNDIAGRLAYNPKILLKVILLAYSRGITSSREIEQACKSNVIFIAMACGQTFDHSTIADFIASLQKEVLPIFLKVLLVCHEMNLLGGSLFALDGTKIPGNASKRWSGTRKELAHKKELLQGQLKRLVERHIESDRNSVNNISSEFQDKQKRKLEEKILKIEKFLQEVEPRRGVRGQELKSNLTDPDSAKMKTSNGTIQGYNSQAAVDDKHQIIVAAQVTNNSADYTHLRPMVQEYKANLSKIGYATKEIKDIKLTADCGYYSFPNLQFCKQEGIEAYIPDHQFRSRDSRYQGQMRHRTLHLFSIGNFHFDQKQNIYQCPAGKNLTSYGRNVRRGDRFVRQYVAKRETCETCEMKSKCLSKNAKRRVLQVPIQQSQTNIIEEMMRRIDSSQGKQIYGKRFAAVEPVFANIKEQKALRRFTYRGKEKVNTQWLLWCMVHNIEKIAKCKADK